MAPFKEFINRLEKEVEGRSAASLDGTETKEAVLSEDLSRVERASMVGLLATLVIVALVGSLLIMSIRRIQERFRRQYRQVVEHEKLSGLGLMAAGMATR